MTGAAIRAVSSILKARFNNLTVEETIDLAIQIIEAVDKVYFALKEEKK